MVVNIASVPPLEYQYEDLNWKLNQHSRTAGSPLVKACNSSVPYTTMRNL
uniref:Uncharacterized protein n=1 Tax=Aegilops tauschii subsp. strangulata TaxID=200361 RepID=A0A453JMD4_AEGTS